MDISIKEIEKSFKQSSKNNMLRVDDNESVRLRLLPFNGKTVFFPLDIHKFFINDRLITIRCRNSYCTGFSALTCPFCKINKQANIHSPSEKDLISETKLYNQYVYCVLDRREKEDSAPKLFVTNKIVHYKIMKLILEEVQTVQHDVNLFLRCIRYLWNQTLGSFNLFHWETEKIYNILDLKYGSDIKFIKTKKGSSNFPSFDVLLSKQCSISLNNSYDPIKDVNEYFHLLQNVFNHDEIYKYLIKKYNNVNFNL